MRAMGFRHPKFFEGHLSCLHLQNERRIFKQILETHFRPSEEELAELLHEVDEDGSGEIEFGADDLD